MTTEGPTKSIEEKEPSIDESLDKAIERLQKAQTKFDFASLELACAKYNIKNIAKGEKKLPF